ncbi:hypothetical protein NX059_010635 [Plenodomus lindquistii]|nr:hypothetical protein NX059_010635 [Plenodomus lindquistii]
MPVRFNVPRTKPKDFLSAATGRETPLPQYEKSQSTSVPFTLNLREDTGNPGQFQLVISIGAKDTAGPEPVITSDNNALREPAANPTSASSRPQDTKKSSPPTSPLGEKQGWADLDNITPDFLQKVVPEWSSKVARSDSTASTQSRKFADIKARIRKTGKGYVVRLLRGSSSDPVQIAEVDLGGSHIGADGNGPQELDSLNIAAELDSTQASQAPTIDAVLGRSDLFEIGSSNESGVERPCVNTLISVPPTVAQTSLPALRHASNRNSIAEDGFSDAETLVPDNLFRDDRRDSEQPDLGQFLRRQRIPMSRTDSTSSIVKTPTRGLSVVGPVRRVAKNYKPREIRSSHLDRPRSDIRKTIETTGTHSTELGGSSSHSSESLPLETSDPRERCRSTSNGTPESSIVVEENNTWQHPQREAQISKHHTGHSLANGPQSLAGAKKNLRLETDGLRSRSTKSSPLERRKKSPRTHSPDSTWSSSGNDVTNTGKLRFSSLPIKVDSSRGLREAVARALGEEIPQSDPPRPSAAGQALPVIIEPTNDNNIGDILLPPDLEVRSNLRDSRNVTLRFWRLALSSLSDKAYEVLTMLRDRYGAEPSVPKGHVRVRWTCSCGDELYDDYIEQRPNAARLFEAYLNRPRAHTPRSPSSQGSSASSMASIFDASSRASTLATPSSTYGGSASWDQRADTSKYSPTRIRLNNPFSVRMPTQVEESWLLTCANEGKLTPKVVHIDVNEGRVRSDKDLALALREHYNQLNNRWYSWARLRGLTTIEFVQFEVHRNRFADIRAVPSMPPKSATSSSISPEPEKSQSPSQHPYTFEPNDLLPPVGSTYLLHLFEHPNDYDGELITYLRSPKRRIRLDAGMGWGVHLVDGFLAQKVWAVTVGIFGLGGAAFAVTWAIKKNDVQGAFGIAQWVLGIAVMLVGGLQAWLE